MTTEITKISRGRIWVTDEIHKELQTEFNTTSQTVYNSLKFFFSSETAVKIRTRAIEMMEETNASNKRLKTEFDGN